MLAQIGFLSYLLRIPEKSVTIPNPRGIREKRPKSGSFPVNTGELETMSLVLFSAVIYEQAGKNLISKTVKYKLDSSSKMQFAFFFIAKTIQKFFGKLSSWSKICKLRK